MKRLNVFCCFIIILSVLPIACSGKKDKVSNYVRPSTTAVFAESPETDFNVALTKDGTGAVITRYNGNSRQIKIPSTIQGMPVKVIGGGIFQNELRQQIDAGKNVTNIVIPEGVTHIESGAFSNSSNLTSVTLPSSLVYIGDNAFEYCGKLLSVNIPNSVSYIGEYAFLNCESLTSVVLPNSINRIRGATFQHCESLIEIIIPEGVERIEYESSSSGGGAFTLCTSLKSVTLPSTIKYIDTWAFAGCSSLRIINIPDSVTSIKFSSDAFEGSPNIPLATQAKLKQLGYNNGRF